ncbi:cell division protein ZapA [Roseovarius halotolerans]|uniref:Cell division protein ZapA n=1 Tax=Roseovarius halotolerans TaxID=505353 RepID=A0A1X6YII4_9RHOB|nr:cell division protein ZapA [Roseovarius halotolerans]RKT34523.1 cell division protein ZapA [Roseovarius halotolerans]SLN22323.1 Cell division protein ZapA [Roseovarius halotolerans]
MPEIEIRIGGRPFEVACQEGEEGYLRAAAKMLDEEASVLSAQIGRIPEARLLLMAGLMLADKTAGIEDKLRQMEDRMAEKEAELDQLRNAPAPAAQTIEVPIVPASVNDALAEIAARAEALADQVDGPASASRD